MGDKRTLSPSVVSIVDGVSDLSRAEVLELLRALEQRLGVAAWPDPITSTVNPPFSRGTYNPPDYSIWVDAPGPNRKQLILLLRERLGLSLADAVALADRLPGLVHECVDPPTADEWLSELRRLGLAGKKIDLG